MGTQSNTNPRRQLRSLPWTVVWILSLFFWLPCSYVRAQAGSPLFLPGGLAYGPQGDLFFAETGRHDVLRLSRGGVLTVLAGNGTQGFSGDGGPAVAASLDSPTAVAVDSAGNIFIADGHNHRIRQVDAVTAHITTFAGTGVAGFSPDDVVASSAALDLPSALIFDQLQNLVFADSRRHIVRRIDHATGKLTTIAGNGMQGAQGDGGKAVEASLDSPAGLAIDATGNLFISDSHNDRIRRVDASGNIRTIPATGLYLPIGVTVDKFGNLFVGDAEHHQIRRIDAVTGQMTTLAGEGVQQFAGDESPATSASLDEPGAITLSPDGLPTISDRHNNRVRQIDAAGIIHTIAGLGTVLPGALALSGPTSLTYGTGVVTASLAGTPATGSIEFTEGTSTLGSVPLANNAASLSTASLPAGAHALGAIYSGDSSHVSVKSSIMSLAILPAPLVASPNAVTLVFGQSIPTLTASLSGALPRDANAITLHLSTTAVALSAPGSYPITGALTGGAAGNYALSITPAAVTITRAPTVVSLTNSLAVHVAPSLIGVPSGHVDLLDGNFVNATATISPTGDAQFSSTSLSNGSHTLSAAYAGDGNFLPAVSATTTLSVGPATSADFTLATLGSSSATVSSGSPATFSFTVAPVNGQLSSQISLAVSGLPPGATASFNPAYLPPGSTPTSFALTIQTQKTAALTSPIAPSPIVFAILLPLLGLARTKRARAYPLILLTLIAGCGDRINTASTGTPASRTFNIIVNATATSASGAALQHNATVILTLQ
jgi:hypothetical protein